MRSLKIIILLAPLLIASPSVNISSSSQHIGTVTGAECTKDSGIMKKEQRRLETFSKVAIDLPAEVSITCTDKQSLTIEADEALMPQISSEVHDGTLYLTIKGSVCTESSIRMQIEMESLSEVDAGATSEVALTCDKIADHTRIVVQDAASLSLKGSARHLDFDLQDNGELRSATIDTEKLDITASGTASITLKGRCASMHIGLEDSTSFEGQGLITKAITIETSGTAEAAVTAKEHLEASSQDASSITYFGQPQQLRVHTSEISEIVSSER